MIIPYTKIPAWCHQGNEADSFGLCAFAGMGNLALVQGLQKFPDVEIESAAREIEGFDPYIHATDTGIALEVLFGRVAAFGWPGDPSRLIQWAKTDTDGIPNVIATRGGCLVALRLPMNEAGDDYDWTDNAMEREASGVYGHAVLIVDCTGTELTAITWGRTQTFPRRWFEAYGFGQYDVLWTVET
jgi:hypothetical protein